MTEQVALEVDIDTSAGEKSARRFLNTLQQVDHALAGLDFNVGGGKTSFGFLTGVRTELIQVSKLYDEFNAKVLRAAKAVPAGRKLPAGTVPGLPSGQSVGQAQTFVRGQEREANIAALTKAAQNQGIALDREFSSFLTSVVNSLERKTQQAQAQVLSAARANNPKAFGPTLGAVNTKFPEPGDIQAKLQTAYEQAAAQASGLGAAMQDTAAALKAQTSAITANIEANVRNAEELNKATAQSRTARTKKAASATAEPAARAAVEYGSQQHIDDTISTFNLKAQQLDGLLDKYINQYKRGLLTDDDLFETLAEIALKHKTLEHLTDEKLSAEQESLAALRQSGRGATPPKVERFTLPTSPAQRELVASTQRGPSELALLPDLRAKINTKLAEYINQALPSGRPAIPLGSGATRPIPLGATDGSRQLELTSALTGRESSAVELFSKQNTEIRQRITASLNEYAANLARAAHSPIALPGTASSPIAVPATPPVIKPLIVRNPAAAGDGAGGGGGARPFLAGAAGDLPPNRLRGGQEESAQQQRANAAFVRAQRAANPSQLVQITSKIVADISEAEQGIVRFFENSAEGATILLASEQKFRTSYQALLNKADVDAQGVFRARATRTPQPGEAARQREAREESTAAKEQAKSQLDDQARAETAAQRALFSDFNARRLAAPENFLKIPGLGVETRADLSDPNNPQIVQKTRRNQLRELTSADADFPEAKHAIDTFLASQVSKSAAEQQYRTNVNSSRVRPDDFIKLPGNVRADISGPIVKFYDESNQRAVELSRLDQRWYTARENLEKVATADATGLFRKNAEQSKKQQQNNATFLRKPGSSEFDDGVFKVNDSLVADVRSGVLRLFKQTAEGFNELAKDAEGYKRGNAKLIQQTVTQSRGGVLASFAKGATAGGFLGDSSNSTGLLEGLAHSAGTTAKYAVLGQTFFAIQKAIAAAGAELLNFEDNLTELTVAMDGVKPSAGFITDLSESAAKAGANVGEAMGVAADGIRAFKDTTDGSRESVEALGTSFATQASRIATLTQTDIADAAGNLKAAALGFDIPEQSFSRITDAIVGAKQIGGGDEKEVSQGLASVAQAFKEIGFSAEETGVIISKVQSATDESGRDIATKLTRITSIVSGSAGQKALRDLNATLAPNKQIGLDESVRDQLVQLGAVYNQLSTAQKKPLINALGGTSSAKELEVVLGNITTLEAKANDPKNFNGKGAEEYAKRLADLGNVLKNIQGEIKNITAALATSGIAEPFFDLIKYGLLPALTLTRKLIQLFDLIPAPIRAGLGYLTVFLAGFKALQTINRIATLPQIPGPDGTTGPGQTRRQALSRYISDAVAPGRAEARDKRLRERQLREDAVIAGGGPAADDLVTARATRERNAQRLQNIARGARGDVLVPAIGRGIASGANAAAPIVTAPYKLGAAAVDAFTQAVTKAAIAAGLFATEVTEDVVASTTLGATTGGVKGAALGAGEASGRAISRVKDAVVQSETVKAVKATFADINASAKFGYATGGATGGARGVGEALGRTNSAQAAKQAAASLGTALTTEFGGSGTIRGGIGKGFKGAGALAASQLGPIGGALIAATAVQGTIEAVRNIHRAVDDFNKLDVSPDGFGAQALADSAKNLRAAANTLQESSSGFFGTIVNATTGNRTGIEATKANAIADAQDFAARHIQARRKELVSSESGNDSLSQLYDLSSADSFSASISAVASTGADATHRMIAFNQALQSTAEAATKGISSLNEINKYSIRQTAAAAAKTTLADQIADASNDASGGGFFARHFSLHQTENAKRRKTAADLRDDLTGVNTGQLQSITENVTKAEIDSNVPLNTPAGTKALAQKLKEQFLQQKTFADPKTADEVARYIAHSVGDYTGNLLDAAGTNVDAATLAAQAGTVASDAGTQASTNASLGRFVIDPNKDAAHGGTLLNQQYTKAGFQVSENADLVGAQQNLSSLQTSLAALKAKPDSTTEQIQQLQSQVDAATVAVGQAAINNLAADQALLEASIPPENVLEGIQQKIKDLKAKIAREATPDKGDLASLLQLQEQEGLQKIADRFDTNRAGVDTRDVVGNDVLNVQQLQAEYDDIKSRGGSKAALARKRKEIDNAVQQTINDEADYTLAQKNAALDQDSAVDQAQAAVNSARTAVLKAGTNNAEAIKAQAELTEAIKQQGYAASKAAQNAANLTIDLTNPVQVANKAVTDAKTDLDAAIANKESPDVIVQKRLDLVGAQAQAESASFSQFMTNISNAQDLGTISHQQYMQYLENKRSYLQNELASMTLTDQQTQQIKDQITQTSLALKSAADTLSGQFNIGDIDIPTPYEIRRAVQGKLGGNDVAKNNSSYSTAANVTNDSSTSSVILNGVPIQDVLTYVRNALGIPVSSSTKKRKTP